MGAVIGTAGHIDHGKTTLVRALTGIDTDRLKEEKARGITIELGFAHLALPGGRTVGVVDVPGHERFVRTMVAGAVGVDLVLLVVAADEGVMPQTREHLDICGLLGVGRGVVALTKIDAVEEDLRALAAEDVRAALAGTAFAEAPIVPCSARSRQGLDELVRAIARALDAPPVAGAWPLPLRARDAPARLPVDRVFTMKGFGTVVTGTLWSGRLATGDEVSLYPGAEARTDKIRGLQVHGHAADAVEAGHRVAVNLPLPKERLARGLVLGRAGTLEPSKVFDAEVELLAVARRPLPRRARVLLHAGTLQVDAVVRLLDDAPLQPGARAAAEIEVTSPIVVLPGDRFILRGSESQRGHGTTLGGGVVLRVLGRRGRRGARTAPAVLAEVLEAARGGDVVRLCELEVARAGTTGVDRAGLARRVAAGTAAIDRALEQLLARRAISRYDKQREAYVAAGALAALETSVLDAVAAAHRAAPLEPGVAREALRAQVADDPKLVHLVVESLIGKRRLIAERERVRLPEHDPGRVAAARGLDDLGERLGRLFAGAGLAPPRPADVAALLGPAAPAQRTLDEAIEVLTRAGRLTKVQTLYFDSAALAELRARLVAFLGEHGAITPQQWKDLVGASRKYTIPLAEHFDAEKLTLRVGDLRKLRG